jgi:RHS repeat-associated protein
MVEVYFDDFKVTHTKSSVIASDDYYPGGAVFNSYTRENSVLNNIKFQETEWQDELGLNLYDFDARLYDPYIWRTPTQDPHAEYYPQISPYSFLNNNPVNFLDPTGMDAFGLAGSNDIATCPTCPNTPQYQPYIDDPNNNYIYDPTSGGVSILLDEVVVTDGQQASMTYAPPAPSFDFELPPLARIGAGMATVAAMTIALVLSPLEAGTGEAEELARINKKNHEEFIKRMQAKYIPAPKTLPGFPGAQRVKSKNQRARWKDSNGDILEWDSQHGEVEVYDKTGRNHNGAADPETGQIKPDSKVPGRTTDK